MDKPLYPVDFDDDGRAMCPNCDQTFQFDFYEQSPFCSSKCETAYFSEEEE